MARIRTIKPEFWTSEKIVECSTSARLLFIGMWNFCDDRGVHKASVKRLKMEVFPGDDITIKEILECIQELLDNKLIEVFSVEDESYWHVLGWENHQRIDRPTKSKNPHPPEINKRTPIQADQNTTILDESSTSARAGREGKGKEGKGKDIYIVKVDPEKEVEKHKKKNEVVDIFCYWQKVMKKEQSKLLAARRRSIETALKNYEKETLHNAIDGCAKSVWHMGENPDGRFYNDIELIFRVTQKTNNIERFSAYKFQEGGKTLEEKLKNVFE